MERQIKTINNDQKYFPVSGNQAQGCCSHTKCVTETLGDIAWKFTEKSFPWGITVELESGENIMVYKKSFTTKNISYRGYFYITGK